MDGRIIALAESIRYTEYFVVIMVEILITRRENVFELEIGLVAI